MRSLCLLVLAVSSVTLGCSICPEGYMDDYATVGGKWQRSDPANGRVGSVFSDPGTVAASYGEPTTEYYSNEALDGEVIEGPVESGEVYYDEGYYSDGDVVSGDEGIIILGEDW